MAPPKSLVLAALLVAVVSAGQVPRGAAGLGGASANTSVLITGKVPCPNRNSINTATPTPFSNANLQLICSGKVLAGATADGNGAFVINMTCANRGQLTAIMGNKCNLVVNTPLAACDASLAGVTGTLTAPLKFLGISTGGSGDLGGLGGIFGIIGQIINGLVSGIVNLEPMGFSLV